VPRSGSDVDVVVTGASVKRGWRIRSQPPFTWYGQQALLADSSWQETGLIFTNSLGKTLDGPIATRRFQQVCQQLGFRRVRFHDLRHAAAALMLESAVATRNQGS